MGENRVYMGFQWGILRERGRLGDPGLDERIIIIIIIIIIILIIIIIIIRCIFRTCDLGVWTRSS